MVGASAGLRTISVNTGQKCTFINGTINGNVNMNGGSLALSDDLVTGNIALTGRGTFSIGPFTTVKGNMAINNLQPGDKVNQVCGSTLYRNVAVDNNSAPVQLGSTSKSICLGNAIGGNLEVLQNTAPIQIFENTIARHFDCENDFSVIGAFNTAQQKQGQCLTF